MQGGTLKLLNLTKRIPDLLAITKLLTVFETFDTEKEAVNSFAAKAYAPGPCPRLHGAPSTRKPWFGDASPHGGVSAFVRRQPR